MDLLHSKIIGNQTEHLLILHGLLGMGDNWGQLAKVFSEKYCCHLLDLRNHGQSFHSDEMNLTVMSKDILAYLTFHQIKKCTILGHSMGGKVAMHLAFHHTEVLYKIIIADIAPKAYTPYLLPMIKQIKGLDLASFSSRNEINQTLENLLPSKAMALFIGKNIKRINGNQFQWKANLDIICQAYPQLVSAEKNVTSSIPALFLIGEKSDYISLEDEPLIHSYFSHAKLVLIPEAGHWLHADNPQAVIQECMTFLDS